MHLNPGIIKIVQKKSLLILYLAIIAYLLIHTGAVSDDFIYIDQAKGKSPLQMLIPKGPFLLVPIENFTHYIWFSLLRIDNLFMLDLLKILYIFLSFYLISRFFSIYLDKKNAHFASFLFIFFPSHDSTTYWFFEQSLTMSFAFYLYSFYLAHKDKLASAFFAAMIASFISYGSPAMAISLFTLFALNKEYKKGFFLLIPNFIYILYYVTVSKIMLNGISKIHEKMDVLSLIKQFVLQVLTFVDATLGPSMWLKLYYSFSQISAISFVVGLLAAMILYRTYKRCDRGYDKKLILSLLVLTVSSFVMFSLTGRYPQLAFNLGNRTTIFGSLLLAYLVVAIPVSKMARAILFTILIFSIVGISDHWKMWNAHEQEVIAKIRNNAALKNYREDRVIYVSGNQYSRFGRISHIEYFSEDIVGCVFIILLGKGIVAEPINKRYKYADGYLIDTKYDRRTKVDDYINVYDSENDSLFRVQAGDISRFIESLPSDHRHWVQLLDVKFLKNLVTTLMPRLKYAI